jgi:hypothetical protein
MCPSLSRRCFLQTTAAGLLTSSSLMSLAQNAAGMAALRDLALQGKIRVAKAYLGQANPGWPMSKVDLAAEVKQFEKGLAGVPELADVEFVELGLLRQASDVAAARAKMEGVTGVLAVHLTMGTGPLIQALMDTGLPVMVFTMPYNGHEWHIISGWQREGRLVEIYPSSRYEDVAVAIRPFRALQRLKETRVLHVSQNEADPKYTKAVKEWYGTEIVSIKLPELEAAYKRADRAEAEADAKRWMREAKKIVEPGKEDVLKASLMYVAMRNLLTEHRAQAITMNCLGMGLMDRGMGYPCLGFVRLNNALLAGVCEADLKSTLTQLIFTYLVGRTGFVTDPMFDLSDSTIIHAHCVAATQMLGPNSRPSPYIIRSHLEDNRGASLQVKMPVGGKVSMARLLGTDMMLYSTGEAVDSPMVERGCRSKLTMRVENIDRFLHNWSSGLHRVIFYGEHTRDLAHFCRFARVRLLREGIDDLQSVQGLDWATYVHA